MARTNTSCVRHSRNHPSRQQFEDIGPFQNTDAVTSLHSERNHWVDLGRTPCWKVSCSQRDSKQYQRDDRKRRGIGRADSIQQASRKPSHSKRGDQPPDHSDNCQHEPLPKDKPEDVALLCAMRERRSIPPQEPWPLPFICQLHSSMGRVAKPFTDFYTRARRTQRSCGWRLRRRGRFGVLLGDGSCGSSPADAGQ